MCEVVFVFGSNLAGRHGAGAARCAHACWGAQYGVGEGRTGMSYAIPTKDRSLRTRRLEDIKSSVGTFLSYATDHGDAWFRVTRIGCGLAGYKDEQIAPMFRFAPPNCCLPAEWATWCGDDHHYWKEAR